MANRVQFNRLLRHCGIAVIVAALLAGAGCRGRPSEKPPIHPNPNMDDQFKLVAQQETDLFANGSSMQMPVEGTVARGYLRADREYYEGRNAEGQLIAGMPKAVTVDMALLKRGQERYQIYCAVCHGDTGAADGIITTRGLVPPPSYHDKAIRDKSDGHYYDVITNGYGRMMSYRHQVPVADRWAIVSYIRALQRSQNTVLSDVPRELREQLTKERQNINEATQQP